MRLTFTTRTDPARAEAAAARVAAHVAALQDAGLPADARVFAWRGLGWWAALARDTLLALVTGAFGLLGFLYHLVPYAVVRLIARFTAGDGLALIALTRLLYSLPVYAAWYAFVWWRLSLYFLPWVAWLWLALMPWAGLAALSLGRRLRNGLPFFGPRSACSLRASARRHCGPNTPPLGRCSRSSRPRRNCRPPSPSSASRARFTVRPSG